MFAGHIPALLAEERIGESMAASVPHLTEEARREVLDVWRELAGVEPSGDGVEKIEWDDFVREIKGR